MVVFTCNHCGESVQKPKVEKHYMTICRRPKFLSCVDCFKDFRNEEYGSHTKCVTEEERYAAKGAFPGGIQKKGAVKQDNWIDLVNSATTNANIRSAGQRKVVDVISNSVNVPRKKKKFINFIRSTLYHASMQDIEFVWDLIEKYKQQQNDKSDDAKANGVQNEEKTKTLTNESQNDVGENKKGKRKLDIVENGDSKNTLNLLDNPPSAFTEFVRSVLKAEVVSNPNHQQLVEEILSLPNVHHKKNKFLKRIQHATVDTNPEDIKSIWDLIEKKRIESNEIESSMKNGERDMEVETEENSLQKSLKKLLATEPNKKQIIDATLNLSPIPVKRSKFLKAIKKVIKDVKVEDLDGIWNIIQNKESNLTSLKESDNVESKKRKKDQSEDDGTKGKKCKVENSENLHNGTNGNIDPATTKEGAKGNVEKTLKKLLAAEPNKKQIIDATLNLNPIPVKRSKYLKAIKKVIKDVKVEDIDAIWNIIQNKESNSTSLKESDNVESKKRKKDQSEDDGTKGKKCKVENSENLHNGTNGSIDPDTTKEVTNGNAEKTDEVFNFKDEVIEIVTKRQSISLSSLEKKIFNKYRKSVGEPTEKIIAKYNKKLKKIDGVEIKDNIISVIQ